MIGNTFGLVPVNTFQPPPSLSRSKYRILAIGTSSCDWWWDILRSLLVYRPFATISADISSRFTLVRRRFAARYLFAWMNKAPRALLGGHMTKSPHHKPYWYSLGSVFIFSRPIRVWYTFKHNQIARCANDTFAEYCCVTKLLCSHVPLYLDKSTAELLAQRWVLQKRMNRSRCRLGCRLAWSKGTIY